MAHPRIPSLGELVWPLGKESHVVMLNCIMMEDVLPKFLTKNGIYGMAIIGIMLETKLKSDVAINQKVLMYKYINNFMHKE